MIKSSSEQQEQDLCELWFSFKNNAEQITVFFKCDARVCAYYPTYLFTVL